MTLTESSDGESLFVLQEARKAYGAVEALKDGNLSVGRAEVVALVGDNGAGKSTLLRIVAGAVRPDGGHATFRGQRFAPSDPSEGRRLGIETVYQNLGLLENLSIEANLFIKREHRRSIFGRERGPFLDKRRMRKVAGDILRSYGLDAVPPDRRIAELSGGQRQLIAIARAAESGAHLILMDEPTAALGIQESARVLELIRLLQSRGVAIVIVSHNLEHVFAIAQRAVVLRQGRTVGDFTTATSSQTEVVHAIVGAEFSR
jgi:D-xylose transport system ATP-binding protein